MRDVLLMVTVIAFMILGFFIVSKADKFFAENYKGFEDDKDEERDTENSVQKDENENKSLR